MLVRKAVTRLLEWGRLRSRRLRIDVSWCPTFTGFHFCSNQKHSSRGTVDEPLDEIRRARAAVCVEAESPRSMLDTFLRRSALPAASS